MLQEQIPGILKGAADFTWTRTQAKLLEKKSVRCKRRGWMGRPVRPYLRQRSCVRKCA